MKIKASLFAHHGVHRLNHFTQIFFLHVSLAQNTAIEQSEGAFEDLKNLGNFVVYFLLLNFPPIHLVWDGICLELVQDSGNFKSTKHPPPQTDTHN